MKRRFLLLLFLAVLHNLHGADGSKNTTELHIHFSPEFNRAFIFCWDITASGALITHNKHSIKGGIALGGVGREFDVKAFTGAEAAVFKRVPFFVSLAYIYNGLPEYETHSHTALPLLSLKWRRAGLSLGPTLRFTTFFGETPLFEPILSFSGYINIIETNSLRLEFRAANFNDFSSDNLGAYYIAVNSRTRLNRSISLINDIEAHQSGSIALAANVYRIVYRGGVVFSW